jgi:hypothetical protein
MIADVLGVMGVLERDVVTRSSPFRRGPLDVVEPVLVDATDVHLRDPVPVVGGVSPRPAQPYTC